MTKKVYKSAMGRTVDLGALILENENVRAVGNMGVNARGDVLDGSNQVIESKTRQVQRQYNKQAKTNVTNSMPTTSTRVAKQQKDTAPEVDEVVEDVEILQEPDPVSIDETIQESKPASPAPRGGLAAAIAKSQSVKQELLKTPRQLAQEQGGLKKI